LPIVLVISVPQITVNWQFYTVGHKKCGSKLFATTFANIDRFR